MNKDINEHKELLMFVREKLKLDGIVMFMIAKQSEGIEVGIAAIGIKDGEAIETVKEIIRREENGEGGETIAERGNVGLKGRDLIN